MTLGDMLADLNDILALAGITPVQGMERNLRTLNRAKDQVVAELELMGDDVFTGRTTLSVAAGDGSSVALPTDYRRMVSLLRSDISPAADCIVVNGREQADWQAAYPVNYQLLSNYVPTCYVEGTSLYCIGTVPAMSLLLRYRKRVADLTSSDRASSYSLLPTEWQPLVVDLAASMLIPAANPEHSKLLGRYRGTMNLAKDAMTRRINRGQLVIAMAED